MYKHALIFGMDLILLVKTDLTIDLALLVVPNIDLTIDIYTYMILIGLVYNILTS